MSELNSKMSRMCFEGVVIGIMGNITAPPPTGKDLYSCSICVRADQNKYCQDLASSCSRVETSSLP